MRCPLIIAALALTIAGHSQLAAKKYVFKQIGWTISLPADFVDLPVVESKTQITPGQPIGDTAKTFARLLVAQSGPNTIMVNLGSCDPNEHLDLYRSHAKIYQSQSVLDREVDSSTTFVSIDGVQFIKFRAVSRKNGLIVENYYVLWACYKGYSLEIDCMLFDKKAAFEIQSMIDNSKFH